MQAVFKNIIINNTFFIWKYNLSYEETLMTDMTGDTWTANSQSLSISNREIKTCSQIAIIQDRVWPMSYKRHK